ncbi:MAG: D-2-hydroxyacid dehydrogenase family protein [Gammaproteobacteria bacterium]
MLKIAILDDYAGVALALADWSEVEKRAEITVFREAVAEGDIAEKLHRFDVICTLRDRFPFTRVTFEKLPNLKALVASDPYVRVIDFAAAAERGVEVLKGDAPADMPVAGNSTGEFAWGLLLATIRGIPSAAGHLRRGEWRQTLGMSLEGKTLGVVGLGRFGARMAEYGRVFDMNVLAWSQNLSPEAAVRAGARLVDKETLFRESDIVTLHYVLSDRSRGLVGEKELNAMKPTAFLINTSRGPIVDEQALIAALKTKRIAGAGLDVFDQEPLPKEHPLLKLDNVVATPHLGFVTEPAMRRFYVGLAAQVTAYVENLQRQ